MRVLGIAAALAALALVSGFTAYEWRSPPEPVRIEPVELLPPPEREPRREPPAKRANERPDVTGGGPAPAPAPAGGGDDDARDDDAGDDDGDDGGGDD